MKEFRMNRNQYCRSLTNCLGRRRNLSTAEALKVLPAYELLRNTRRDKRTQMQ